MKKEKLIIIVFSLILAFLFLRTGSSMDYLSQHIVFPNYFRELFYSTGEIIPNFMFHIGAGENIFNVAYFGFLNPIILLSYLFPFIKMIDYILISNIVLFIFSNLLFYKFVSDKFKNPLFLTFLFMLSGPLLFQFHRHFMFVNYMPFLILALINIDRKKHSLFIIDLFLIIMTSFYYSIPSIMVILIYYIYINFDKFNIKKFLKFIGYIFISVLMASILLVPTFYSIISTRVSNSNFDFSILIPNINLDNILYGGYSIGLTSIAFVSFIYLLFSKNKKNIFMFVLISIICFLPICLYLLNGGLYVRAKALIPFLPLFVYIIGLFIDNIDNIDFKKFFIFVIFINLIVLIRYHVLVYYVDLLFVILLLFLYSKFKKKNIIYIPIVLLSLIISISYNFSENYFDYDYYNSLNSDKMIYTNYRVSNLNSDSININSGNYISSIYSSTVNKYYSDLYHNVFHVNNGSINNLMLSGTDNVLFNNYMGVKYVYSDYQLGYPYKKVVDGLYELSSLPIGYVNSKCVNEDYFNSLKYPYNLDILSNYVVSSSCDYKPVSAINEIDLDYYYELGTNSYINEGKLYVAHDDVIKVHINNDLNGKLLFINVFDQVEQDNDIVMSINGQSNLLTHKGWLYSNKNYDFYYLVSGNDLNIKVSKGVYNISSIKTYVMDYKLNYDYDLFNIDYIGDDKISGNISVNNPGEFMLKIPYDKGFNISVNGNEVNYEIVNNSFIGFYLDKGDYNIVISYVSPGFNLGRVFTCMGFIIFGFIIFLERKEKNED